MKDLRTPEEVLAAARYIACNDLMPYFGVAIHNCVVMWVKGYGTIGISDRMHLIIDPDQWMKWYQECDLSVLGWILIHEVNHPLREHADRARRMGITRANAQICNACEDAEINDDFPEPRKCLPEGFCWLPEDLQGQENGLTWEEYYAALPTNDKGMKYIPGHESMGEDRPEPGKGPNKNPQEGGQCGSGATGHANEGEPTPADAKNGDAHAGKSDADIERIRTQVAEGIQSHQHTHGRGSVPGGLSRWAGQRLKPPVIPWRHQLRRACRHAVAQVRGQTDYTYNRPSRRQSGLGNGLGCPVLPRMFSPVPDVRVGVDTSGSMSAEDLSAAMGEVQGAMQALGNVPVTMYTCDAEVHTAKKVTRISEACTALVGGGGTDFRPIFDEIVKERGRGPDILAIFTDGDGPTYAVNPLPGVKIIWVVIAGCVPYDEDGNEVTYGTVIHVPAGGQDEQ